MKKKIEEIAQLITIVSYLKSVSNTVNKELYKRISSLTLKLDQEIVKESLSSLSGFTFAELEQEQKTHKKMDTYFSAVKPVSGIADAIEDVIDANRETSKVDSQKLKKKFSVKRTDSAPGSDE